MNFFVYLFLKIISKLPFWAIYLLSDFLFLIIFYVLKYRKKIIKNNLQIAFPQKNKKEIQKIIKNFYVYLIDVMLETLKMSNISETTLQKRIYFKDLSIINQLSTQKKNFILALGHCGNWEWGSAAFQTQTQYQILVVYKPLSNDFFDNLVLKWRTRFGQKASAMKATLRNMIQLKNELFATALIADQRPENPNDAHWSSFLNQEAGFLWGTEKLSQKFNYPVVFANVIKEKRGYYAIELKLLEENPTQTKEGEITQKFIEQLEFSIQKYPETWLWSHDRWKHQNPQK
ncbi:MAG: lipid A biosynthesis acyltransferase [Bacteroidetes bacterium]|nr:MAG: lipid A biosynthesis acyltransferase [Bacteroidota bacterium]TAG89137.1 MAG: lipid A biosynthesis acyltransferase [Bacteroidota bacterium]